MLKKLYLWLLALAQRKYASTVLGIVAFLESSCFPIPPDAFLVPLVLGRRENAWRYATIATLCSVAGGFLGYWIGFHFSGSIEDFLTHHWPNAYHQMRDAFNYYGVYIILIKGVMFWIPFKLITISAGIAHFDLFTFAWTSLVARGIRFFGVSFVTWKYGPGALPIIERHLSRITIGLISLAIFAYLIYKYAL